jgi:diguanylate cyclase (GGDEF)-like protein
VALIETFAELAAVACNNASLHAALAQVARTDALTGCANHTGLHEVLQREIERTRRGLAAAPSVVMFDIDDFKAINDRHGHALGDEVLRRVGHGLRTGTREYDLAARYGGDEFALLCVEATEGEAVEIARRALERLGAAIGDVGGIGFGHATAGVAEWEPDLSPAELLNRAQRGMLHGKEQGGPRRRARVQRAAGLVPPRALRPHARARRRERPSRPRRRHGPRSTRTTTPRRLRARTRGLAAAAALGTSLAVLLDARAIAAAAAQRWWTTWAGPPPRSSREASPSRSERRSLERPWGRADRPGSRAGRRRPVGHARSQRRADRTRRGSPARDDRRAGRRGPRSRAPAPRRPRRRLMLRAFITVEALGAAATSALSAARRGT